MQGARGRKAPMTAEQGTPPFRSPWSPAPRLFPSLVSRLLLPSRTPRDRCTSQAWAVEMGQGSPSSDTPGAEPPQPGPSDLASGCSQIRFLSLTRSQETSGLFSNRDHRAVPPAVSPTAGEPCGPPAHMRHQPLLGHRCLPTWQCRCSDTGTAAGAGRSF